MERKVLQEYLEPIANQAITELTEDISKDGKVTGKSLKMKGIFIQGDVKNHNGRIYPSSEIKRAVESVQEMIKRDLCPLGELDHPDDLKINLDRVSHVITELHMEGANGIGTLKLLDTPMGQLAKVMLEAGVKLGVSSRGSGEVDDYSGKVKDFEIITVDIVATPSAPDAYPRAVYESLMNMRGGNKLFEMARDTKAQKHIQKNLIEFIRQLRLK